MNEREVAVFALMDITEGGGYNNIILARTLKKYDGQPTVKRAMVTELVNGALRNLIRIDYIIGLYSKTPVEKIKPFIKSVLRISIYQILCMDKIPDSAACNEAVKLVKAKGFTGLSGFVNGLLRNVSANKLQIAYPDRDSDLVRHISIVYSFPKWLVKYWLTFMDEDLTIDLCEKSNKTPSVAVCINTIKTTGAALVNSFEEQGAAVEGIGGSLNGLRVKGISNLRNMESFREGLFHVMDSSAMKAVELLNLKKGDRVLDLCAAPGGKSFYAAILMEDEGQVLAMDIHDHKLDLIKKGADRLGLRSVEVCLNDAGISNPGFMEKWDAVLLDAPCSGLGVLNKKPDARYTKTMADVDALVQIQRNMLCAAASYPAPGGRLMYSTCTISVKENEENVRWFLENFPYEMEREMTIYPGDGDGFFAAVLKRKG